MAELKPEIIIPPLPQVFVPPAEPFRDVETPRGFLETCQTWQEVIDLSRTIRAKKAAIKEALTAIRSTRESSHISSTIVKTSRLLYSSIHQAMKKALV